MSEKQQIPSMRAALATRRALYCLQLFTHGKPHDPILCETLQDGRVALAALLRDNDPFYDQRTRSIQPFTAQSASLAYLDDGLHLSTAFGREIRVWKVEVSI